MSSNGDGNGSAPAGPAELVRTATIARRFFLEEASKSDIAAELGLSRFKVARLLRQARESGLVRIELDYRGEIDLDLSVELRAALGLEHSVVVDAPGDDVVALRANLGRAAAGLLSEIVTADDVLGLACGRSLMAMRTALTRLEPCQVVQMTGALSQQELDESSIELVRDVARAGNGEPLYFYAPMIVPDADTARALRGQPELARTTARFGELTIAVSGIGAWAPGMSTVADTISANERKQLHDQGVRAEVCGLQLDADGQSMDTSLSERRIGIGAEELRAVPDVIGIVYDPAKAEAAHSAVSGGLVKSLVTHTALARRLLELA